MRLHHVLLPAVAGLLALGLAAGCTPPHKPYGYSVTFIKNRYGKAAKSPGFIVYKKYVGVSAGGRFTVEFTGRTDNQLTAKCHSADAAGRTIKQWDCTWLTWAQHAVVVAPRTGPAPPNPDTPARLWDFRADQNGLRLIFTRWGVPLPDGTASWQAQDGYVVLQADKSSGMIWSGPGLDEETCKRRGLVLRGKKCDCPEGTAWNKQVERCRVVAGAAGEAFCAKRGMILIKDRCGCKAPGRFDPAANRCVGDAPAKKPRP